LKVIYYKDNWRIFESVIRIIEGNTIRIIEGNTIRIIGEYLKAS